jgi:hypothetical protein
MARVRFPAKVRFFLFIISRPARDSFIFYSYCYFIKFNIFVYIYMCKFRTFEVILNKVCFQQLPFWMKETASSIDVHFPAQVSINYNPQEISTFLLQPFFCSLVEFWIHFHICIVSSGIECSAFCYTYKLLCFRNIALLSVYFLRLFFGVNLCIFFLC